MKVELVTSLKRHATRILAEFRTSKDPILIAEHRQPTAYQVDLGDYVFQMRQRQILDVIAKGERDI